MERILSVDHNTWNRHDPVLIISLVFPNGQDLRPVLTGDSIFIKAVQTVYHTDTPTNVLQVFMYLTLWHAALRF